MSLISVLYVERLDRLPLVLREETRRVQFLHWHPLSDGHDPIGRVVETGDRLPSIGEEGGDVANLSLVHHSALVEQDQVIEGVEDF